MTKRRRAPAPILDPAFVWIPAASHDADSTLFRERQRARIAKAQAKPAPSVVAQIKRRTA